jgi:ribosomal protein S6
MNEENNQNDRQIYEIGYHLLPTVEEPHVPAEAVNLKSIVEENGGSVISEEMPKMTPLAFVISKNIESKKQNFNKAYFGWIKFEAEPSRLKYIKNKADNLASVLRFIIIKTVREDTLHVPKIPMFKKENNVSKEPKGDDLAEKPKASSAEIDKSIDDLVIEN